MAEPSKSDVEKIREDLREKRERNVRRQDQLFDPSPIEKFLLFAVVALTIAVIVLGVKVSNVDGGSDGCGRNHYHKVWAPLDC